MKNIIITGGTTGFGKSLSRVFLQNDFKIIITSRSKEKNLVILLKKIMNIKKMFFFIKLI